MSASGRFRNIYDFRLGEMTVLSVGLEICKRSPSQVFWVILSTQDSYNLDRFIFT